MIGTADVSVIVPAWRAADTIGRALASVAAQTVTPREVVVVDDGSDDGTAEIARAMASSMGGIPVKVIALLANAGAGAARNRAIAEARGEFVALLDADDEWLPEKLARSLAVMEESGADLISHDYVEVRDGCKAAGYCARHCPPGADPFEAQLLRGFIATSTVVIRRRLILAAGGFDPGLRSGQDYELWLSVCGDPNLRFRAFPEALSRYHIREGSISTNVRLRRRAALAILCRHLGLIQRRSRRPRRVAAIRTLIVHMQAALAYAGQGRYLAAVLEVASAPFSLLGVLAAFGAPPFKRPDYLGLGVR